MGTPLSLRALIFGRGGAEIFFAMLKGGVPKFTISAGDFGTLNFDLK
jgi:hypothetical protein